MTLGYIHCVYCEQQHTARFLCDPAKTYLDATLARGKSFDMPTLEFDQPMRAFGLGDHPGDALVQQLVIKGGTAEVGGVARPVIVLTGRAATGETLPQWVYMGSDDNIRASRDLFVRMADLALSQARKERRR